MNRLSSLFVKCISPNVTGATGVILTIIGTQTADLFLKNIFFLIGCLFILATALWIKHRLFSYMEWVILVGILLAFTPFPLVIKGAVPLLMGASLVFLLFQKNRIHSVNDWVGLASLIGLALGFSIATPAVYFAGAFIGLIYSCLEWKDGVPSSWLWAVLNLAFCISILL